MSQLQDSIALSALLTKEEPPFDLTYAKRELQYLTPSVSDYKLSVQFDTQIITDRWCDLTEAFLLLPVTIAGAAAFGGDPTAVAFKSSVLSLIQGVVIKTATGQVLVDDRDSPAFANHLHLCMEKDPDWLASVGEELMYARDRTLGDAGLTTTAQIQYPCVSKYLATPTAGVVGSSNNNESPFYNDGFRRRCRALTKATYSDTGAKPANFNTLSCTLRIPLKYIHDFFMQMAFPIIGTRLQFQFFINNTSTSSFEPITLGSFHQVAGANVQAAGGATTVTVNATPRLYYHFVQYRPEQASIAAAQAAKGITRSIRYRTYTLVPQLNVANSSSLNYQIVNADIAVKKIWVQAYPAGLVQTNGWPSTLVTGANGIKNIKLRVNNQQLLENPLSTLDEQYEMLKRSMHMGEDSKEQEALISFQEFRLTNRLVPIDLSRWHSMVADPNVPMSIVLEGVVESQGAVDIYYLVEKEMLAELSFTTQGAMVKVGAALVR